MPGRVKPWKHIDPNMEKCLPQPEIKWNIWHENRAVEICVHSHIQCRFTDIKICNKPLIGKVLLIIYSDSDIVRHDTNMNTWYHRQSLHSCGTNYHCSIMHSTSELMWDLPSDSPLLPYTNPVCMFPTLMRTSAGDVMRTCFGIQFVCVCPSLCCFEHKYLSLCVPVRDAQTAKAKSKLNEIIKLKTITHSYSLHCTVVPPWSTITIIFTFPLSL